MKNKFTEPSVELMKFFCAGETDDENMGEGTPSYDVDIDDLLNQ